MQPRHHPPSVQARSLLREHTQAAHLELHELALFRALVSGALDLDGYGCLLSDLHDYYLVIDEELASACTLFGTRAAGYSYQPRAPLFAQDLDALGVARTATCSASGVLPCMDTPAALIGALYVIEGSLLGGATLDSAARRLLTDSDESDARGRRYWAWCRSEGALRWRTINLLIERWLTTAQDTGHAIEAACTTFARMHAWLQSRAAARC